jgi:hypothetical protein
LDDSDEAAESVTKVSAEQHLAPSFTDFSQKPCTKPIGAIFLNVAPSTRFAECQQDCWAKDNCRQGCLHCIGKKQKCSLVQGAAGLLMVTSGNTLERTAGAQERLVVAMEESNKLLHSLMGQVNWQEHYLDLVVTQGQFTVQETVGAMATGKMYLQHLWGTEAFKVR